METIAQIKQKMQQAISVLEEDFRTLRPGRASADLVGSLPVAAYNGNLPLNQVASISANDQGQLIIQPWDKQVMAAAEKAIQDSQLGFSVVNEGTVLRLSLPPLSQERRGEFVKIAHQKAEATRINLRQIRTDALQHATREKAAGTVREDELTRLTKELNDIIDQSNQQTKTLADQKEKELLSA
ncbi:MAG TPA: ribosome-recycling factor [Candidatus Saccharimonadales bacterium]|nr:ribosome-recycling factor [Candidatus Saccharimonadales bacterium]